MERWLSEGGLADEAAIGVVQRQPLHCVAGFGEGERKEEKLMDEDITFSN